MPNLTVEYMDSLPHSELPDPRIVIDVATADTVQHLRPALPLARSLVRNLRDAGYFARIDVSY